MKKSTLIVSVLLLFSIASYAQKVGDKVQIQHNGTWYDGKILKVNAEEEEYYVSYDGWSESWNEWVGSDRLKGFSAPEAPKAALRKYKVGDRVEVEYGMIPEPATVMEVGENKYRIKYDKKVFGEKWVTEAQIKKL
jgi:hypothetical protein